MAKKLDFKKNNKLVTEVMQKSSEDLNNKKRDIPLSDIHMNPDNEAVFGLDDIDYLAENIKEDGFAGAIEVYALSDGTYEISSGHRRYLAAKEIGMEKIPCIVSEDVDDVTKSKRLVKSNILNRKMTPLKWAKTLNYYKTKVLNDYPGKKNDELARVFKMSEATVKRLQYLLKLVPELQELADYEGVSYTNLIAVANLAPDEQRKVYSELKNIYPNEANVFTTASKIQVEQWINKVHEASGRVSKADLPLPSVEQVQNRADEEEKKEKIVAPTAPISSGRYEDSIQSSIENEISNMNRQIEEARVIDNQLSIYASNMHELVKKKFEISEETRQRVIDELTQILDELKKNA